MATIRIDGRSYEVEAGQNLLHAALSEAIDLPYFCWHPALGSVGACRQCAVMQYTGDEDERGRLVMACMTPVADGMRFSVEAAHASEFRRSVIEWLMMSHPHDCPVCEEGGECHLQDMTVMTGHVARVYPGTKRTWRNQYLGPFINHEMNRCITCYRCVRFYRDYAGGDDLEDFGSRDRVFFGRAEDGVLENEFSGNLVEVCPTGVFTDRPFAEHYSRKWDLQSAPSVCPGCALGCNTLVSERYGELRRVHNRYHPDVNRYFLCDRGRFGQAFVNSERRLRHAGVRADVQTEEAGAQSSFDEIDAESAVKQIADALGDAWCVGVGSPRASLESNHALASLVGAENFCAGVASDEEAPLAAALTALRSDGVRIVSLAEVEAADAILVLGEDPIDSAPRLALALRQAVHGKALEAAATAGIPLWQDAGVRSHGRYSRHPLYLATTLTSRSAEIAADTFVGSPVSLASLGFAVASWIRSETAPEGWDASFVREAAAALLAAERPLIVSGTGTADAEVVRAASAVAAALTAAGRDPGVCMVAAEANAFGSALLGATRTASMSMDDVLTALESDAVDLLIVAENDLVRRADAGRMRAALARARRVVVIDAVEHDTAAAAHWVLPAASIAECEGTFVNNEGRAQRFFPAIDPPAPLRPTWRWLVEIGAATGRAEPAFEHVDEVIAAIADSAPELEGVRAAAPGASWRNPIGMRVARETPRYSGRTAMRAHVSVHEPKAAADQESALSWSMEGSSKPDTPAALTPYYWAPGWNSNQAVTRFQQEVGGALRGGEPGALLLDGGGSQDPAAATARDPRSGGAGASGLRLLPLRHIFGSDELSALAPALAERIPVPQLVLSPTDAARLQLQAGDGVRMRAGGEDCGVFRLGVDADMETGWAGFSCGLPGGPGTTPAGEVRLEPVPDWTPPVVDNVIARG